jgi:hypothetical protein
MGFRSDMLDVDVLGAVGGDVYVAVRAREVGRDVE